MPEPHWSHHLTLDTLLLILHRSIFHPFIALLIPLSLRACAKPYTSTSLQLSLAWAVLVITCHLLAALNRRIAYGPPREVDWEEEIVLITGGSSGLGRCLAGMYGMRGASVAVLDVVVPEEGLQGVRFYRCDVSQLEAVQRAKEKIEADLGTPTILINNAALPITGTAPLASLSAAHYTPTLTTNLHAAFHTTTTFLPGLLRSPTGGTIVTIASVLGKLGAANLSAYTASKAGLIALHHSLTAELRAPDAAEGSGNVRTLLVTPGQLATGLFADVKVPWYAHFLGPVVEPVELAREIVRRVDVGEGGEVSLPVYAGWIEWVFVLPAAVQRGVRWVAGIDAAVRVEGKKER